VLIAAVLAWAVFAYIVLIVPPEIGGKLVGVNFIYFFVAGWLATAATAALALYFINFLFGEAPRKRVAVVEENLIPRRIFRRSARRSAIFASALAGLGLLKIYQLDNLLNSVFIILIALLIEVYFSSR